MEYAFAGILFTLLVVWIVIKNEKYEDRSGGGVTTPVPTTPKKKESLDFSSMKVAELKSHIKSKGKTKGLPTKKADLVSLAKKLGDQEIK